MGIDKHIMVQSYNAALWSSKMTKLDLNLSLEINLKI